MSEKVMDIKGLQRSGLRDLVRSLGQSPYRGDQIFHWIHARGVLGPDGWTNVPAALRDGIATLPLEPDPVVEDRLDAPDGTSKLVVRLADGYRIECVVIPPEPDSDAEAPVEAPSTLCVSTQVGCRVRCAFCRSGREGLVRDLGAGEIVSQAILAARAGAKVGRIVFMGIGEPLDNYEAVAGAIRILADEQGAGLALRRLVVSTVGRVEGIRRLGGDFGGRVGLAVSLHAATPRIRSRLVGARSAPGAGDVIAAARDYPLPARERVTVEVVLVRGVNDDPGEAASVAELLAGLRCRVNIIPLNPFDGLALEAPAPAAVEAYRDALARRGIPVFVRRRRGDRIRASCGQLAFGPCTPPPRG